MPRANWSLASRPLAGLCRALVDGALPRQRIGPGPARLWSAPDRHHGRVGPRGLLRGPAGTRRYPPDEPFVSIDFIVDYQDRGCTPEEARATALAAFAADWQERCGEMDELKEVFGLLPDGGKHTRWDLIRGLPDGRKAGRMSCGSESSSNASPELAGIIRGLGRARQVEVVDEASLATVQVMDQAVAQPQKAAPSGFPICPGKPRPSSVPIRIARMLPAEAVPLGHPACAWSGTPSSSRAHTPLLRRR